MFSRKRQSAHVRVPVAVLPDGNRINFRLGVDGEDLNIIREVYGATIYERLFRPSAGDIVIDVGSHIGVFTVKAAKRIGPVGKVISIEANPSNYAMLTKNIRLNRLANVIALNLAISNRTDVTIMYIKGTGRHSLLPRSYWRGSTIEVHTDTLDNLVSKLHLKQVDIIKIDVEGLEMEVLQGGSNIIEGMRPKIVLETHTELGGPQLRDLINFLRFFGYKTWRIRRWIYCTAEPLRDETQQACKEPNLEGGANSYATKQMRDLPAISTAHLN